MLDVEFAGLPAYQGDGWTERLSSVEFTVKNETAQLREAKLVLPSHAWRTEGVQWRKHQYLRVPDFLAIRDELLSLAELLESHGVQVELVEQIDPAANLYNSIFARDAVWVTPWGAVVGRMASAVRQREEAFVRLMVAHAGLPTLATVPRGTLEAADILWLSDDCVLVGVGNRTTMAAAAFLATLLRELSVMVTTVQLSRRVQHLLGALQFVGRGRVLLRPAAIGERAAELIQRHGYKVESIEEDDEVVRKQAMNVVVLNDRQIIMPSGCSKMKARVAAMGVEPIETSCDALLAGAGGLACATGMLRRWP